MTKPLGIVREHYDPDGPWVERDGERLQRTYLVVIADDLEWHGPEHDKIVDYAANEMLKRKRHPKELIIIQQLNPKREAERPA